MATISAFRVTQHSQIFSVFFRNRIQCNVLYQLYNSQALLNLRHGDYRLFKKVCSTTISFSLNHLLFIMEITKSEVSILSTADIKV